MSNIVKKLTISDDQMEVIKEALGKLKHISKSKDSKEIITQLEVVKNECEKGIEVRVAAGIFYLCKIINKDIFTTI